MTPHQIRLLHIMAKRPDSWWYTRQGTSRALVNRRYAVAKKIDEWPWFVFRITKDGLRLAQKHEQAT